MKRGMKILVAGLFATFSFAATAEEIGEVSTTFNLLSPNSKIIIEAFDDPSVAGISCHVSKAQTGGLKGAVGLAEDPSEASIACRQVGAIDVTKLASLKNGDTVFKESRSLLLKKLQVVRFYDKKRNVLVYLAYSDKLIDGSPKNSISSVPVMKWN